jgi:putative membrane protein insertion efficiency factor
MRILVLGAIRGYQILISPMLPPTCRYHPSCSSYALQAVRRWGVLRGAGLGLRRVLRCHPWAAGGLDPVPGVPDGNQK